MLEIKKEHFEKLAKIKGRFLSKTKIPLKDNWKFWTNNDLWLHLIKQVMVVGGSAPADKFDENSGLKRQLTYEKLTQVKNEEELKKIINQVLRAVGTRYASSDISKCKKTNALAHNLKVLKGFREGPRALIRRLSEFTGLNSDKRRIKYLMKILKFIQSKSARDYLMELGLVKNAIALDVRVQNILETIGIKFPKRPESSPEVYDEIEKDLLLKLCKPLGLSGIEFDRMLYQNYKNIMNLSWK